MNFALQTLEDRNRTHTAKMQYLFILFLFFWVRKWKRCLRTRNWDELARPLELIDHICQSNGTCKQSRLYTAQKTHRKLWDSIGLQAKYINVWRESIHIGLYLVAYFWLGNFVGSMQGKNEEQVRNRIFQCLCTIIRWAKGGMPVVNLAPQSSCMYILHFSLYQNNVVLLEKWKRKKEGAGGNDLKLF